MDISFQKKKLEKLALNPQKCLRELGKIRATLFLQRIDDLSTARTLEDVRFLPGHYHELTGDRKGQWACDLNQPYRLIFEPHEDPIPTDENGKYVWIEIKGVEIIEITNYHGK
ncbi:MAG: type II toxin-antitoxin system RelE/ParE family toxin [Prevotella sp.]|nr:type II toxin-antitoxin system RelE/ParE family toxin [Prevotella sp.]